MIDYQKFAYICFRVAGIIIFIVGISMFLSSLIVASPAISIFSILKVYVPYLSCGSLVFISSGFLAKLVCLNLNEEQ